MRLFNVVLLWDVYAVAENEADAIAAIKVNIETGEISASEAKAFEAREPRNIRRAWQDLRPAVGAEVSDQDFERCKGKNTTEIQAMLYQRQAPKK